jgi:hypothetical protein
MPRAARQNLKMLSSEEMHKSTSSSIAVPSANF